MAFVVGERVRVKLTSLAFTGSLGRLQPQPPVIGVVTDVTGTTVYANMGPGITLVEDATVLDEINDPDTVVRDTFIDKVVLGTGYSSTYQGRVVDVYKVNGSDRVLIQALINGAYYELPFTGVTVLGGR